MVRRSRWLVLSLALLVAGCGGGGGGGGTASGGTSGGGGGTGNVTRTFHVPAFGGTQIATAVVSYEPAASTGAAADVTVAGSNRTSGRVETQAEAPATAAPTAAAFVRDMPQDVRATEGANRESGMRSLRATGPGLEGVQSRFDDATIPEGGTTTFYIATTGQTITAQKMHADADTTATIVFAEVVGGTPVVNKATALTMDSRFGTSNPFDLGGMGIGPRVRGIFGHEWNTAGGRDGETKVVLVALSSTGIGGAGLYGFFRPNDEFSKAQVSNSNEGEILYLNATYFTGDMYDGLATVAHEFQHMCNFNQKFVHDGAFNGVDEDDTINEGLSVLAEELTGFSLTSAGGGNSFMFAAARGYLQAPYNYPYFTFGNSNGDYGKGYLLMKYIRDRFGTATITTLATSTGVGRPNVASATGESFELLFQEWALANLMDPVVGAPAPYFYSGLNLDANYSIRVLGTVTLPSATMERTFNPPSSTVTLSLDPWTATYVRFSGGGGAALDATLTVPTATATNLEVESPAKGTFGSLQ